jgi:hypothetical protein
MSDRPTPYEAPSVEEISDGDQPIAVAVGAAQSPPPGT